MIDESGHSPLYYSIFFGNVPVTKELLEKGADPTQICDKNNNNMPLHIAFQSGSLEIIMILIQLKADLNSINTMNYTPMAYASQSVLKKLNLFNSTCTLKN